MNKNSAALKKKQNNKLSKIRELLEQKNKERINEKKVTENSKTSAELAHEGKRSRNDGEIKDALSAASKKKKKKKTQTTENTGEAESKHPLPEKIQKATPPSQLQQKMQKKLDGARFRWINEKFYTSLGSEAFELTKNDPSIFEEYHKGFIHQVKSWPLNPVDLIIAKLEKEKAGLTIADMGCGEAKIAQELSSMHKIHSFDLVAHNKFIVACDISKVPLKNESADISIFCLALMGTNWVEFVLESNRILKKSGELVIAEVISRIPDVDTFVESLLDCGFELVKKDNISKMFIFFIFKKIKNVKKSITADHRSGADSILKPCIYKRR